MRGSVNWRAQACAHVRVYGHVPVVSRRSMRADVQYEMFGSMQYLPHADLENVSPENCAHIIVEARIVRAYYIISMLLLHEMRMKQTTHKQHTVCYIRILHLHFENSKSYTTITVEVVKTRSKQQAWSCKKDATMQS